MANSEREYPDKLSRDVSITVAGDNMSIRLGNMD